MAKALRRDDVVDQGPCTVTSLPTVAGWPVPRDHCAACDLRKDWEEESLRYARVHGGLRVEADGLRQENAALVKKVAEMERELARWKRSAEERLGIILSSMSREVVRPLRRKELE